MSKKTKSDSAQRRRSAADGSVICIECKTVHRMGNGITGAAHKLGYVHLYSLCPKCGRKTWSEPFILRPMTN